MGCFSWIYSDTNKAMKNGVKKESYLLVPPKFQSKYGEHIVESCYDGYGRFGGYDIYELILEWNKDMIDEVVARAREGLWVSEPSEDDIANFIAYRDAKPITCEPRWLGILLACYDRDNFALRYPIKITAYKNSYMRAEASKTDPMQGCV